MSLSNFYNAQIGNWKLFTEEALRLKPEITMNDDFFNALATIHSCLPYLDENYFQKNIKLNILYYSHIYGNYPDFQVIGDLLQLNYKPTINENAVNENAVNENAVNENAVNKDDKKSKKKKKKKPSNIYHEELTCLRSLYKNTIETNDYGSNFKLANEHFNKYFKFNKIIHEKVNSFARQFEKNKVLGLYYKFNKRETGVAAISIYDFIRIVDDQLLSAEYDIIFIVTKNTDFINIMKKIYSVNYKVLFYDTSDDISTELLSSNRLAVMKEKMNELKISKKNRNNQNKLDKIEFSIVDEIHINRKLLQYEIINSLLLSKCDFVLKTHSHSQLSAYSKIFNPSLKIYKVNGSQKEEWPESSIPFYDHKNVKTIKVKNILKNKLKSELEYKIDNELKIGK